MSIQSEMKLFGISDAEVLKQHFGRKIMELEDEKRVVQVQYQLCKFFNTTKKIKIHICACFMNTERERLSFG